MPELDTRDDGPPQYREQAPLTPPASDAGTHQEDGDGDGNELIRKLQEEVVQNGRRIQRLESELESEKGNRNRLQAERHEAVALQRQAAEGEEIRKMKQQIANLDDLLNGSIKRQKELESELDLCRQESHELKRRLHEERDVYESEIRARETRERLDRQQVEYENEATGAGIGRQRGQDGFGGVMMEGEVRGTGSSGYDGAGQRGGTNTVGIDASGRSRRDSRGTAGRAYVSIPKRGNRRALWMLS